MCVVALLCWAKCEREAGESIAELTLETELFRGVPIICYAGPWKPTKNTVLEIDFKEPRHTESMARRTITDSAWVIFALCLRSALCADSGKDFCSAVCALIKADLYSSDSCAKARRSLPRPTIGLVCQVRQH